MPSVEIVDKSELTEIQKEYVLARISDAEHAKDTGPSVGWTMYPQGNFAVIEIESGNIIGLADATGTKEMVVVGWWVDSKYREMGYGKALVNSLAKYLKVQGYTGVGEISVQSFQGKFDAASNKLKLLFTGHFNNGT